MSNAVMSDWPSGVANTGWPSEPSAMLMPGMVQGWPAGTQRAANAAQRLLSQAVAYWDVGQYRDGDRFLRNRGTGGELLDLRLGSSIVANSNDPQYLAPDDQGYVYLPSVAGNSLSVPHSAGTQVGDSIDIRLDMAADSWLPGSTSRLIGKATADSAAGISFGLSALNTARLQLNLSDGTTNRGSFVTVLNAAPFTTAQRLRLRVTYVRDTGAGQQAVDFYYNDSDFNTPLDALTSWTQLGTTQTGASLGATNDVDSPVRFGNFLSGTSVPLSGRYYGGCLIVGGSTVAVLDCDNVTSGSQTSWVDAYQTVTVNRSTTGRKSVAVPSRHKGGKPVMLLGTDDYLEIPAENGWQDTLTTALRQGQSYTVMAIVRHWPTLNRSAGLIGADLQTSSVNRWNLITTTSGGGVIFFAVDASNSVTQAFGSTSGGTVQTYCGVMDANSQTLYTANNGTSGAPVTLRSFTGMGRRFTLNVGRWGTANLFDGEFYGALVDRRAWSLAEIKTVADYFTGRIA